ncbi:MAG: aminopeptidase [Paludibacteraceae bacterium]|nr:aminopeptidase [Paludibacteraceae bacterium]
MKLLVLLSLILSLDTLSTDTPAKDTTDSIGFQFTTIDSVGITPVKDQHRSGTCWAFSTIGFFESEVMRLNKGKQVDLSEMFVVNHTMMDRAEYVIRMYGDVAFAAGGSAYDVLYCLRNYGMVPQSIMPGIQYGTTEADTLPMHNELDAISKGYINALCHNSKIKRLTPVWKKGLQAVYDTYLGQCPDSFIYEGRHYTPQSYVKSLGLNPNDYVSITSYTHHPFYTRFALEVPDNWRMEQMYNVPLDEMMAIIDNAIQHGYTMAWGADVSEPGFTRKGIGVMPDVDKGADLTGSDMAKWLGMDEKSKSEELTKKPLPEMEITQELRQRAFDNWETTDDHGMQIFGTAKDQNGKLYYLVKNSWGTKRSKYSGIWYISRAFMEYKTNTIMVHKDAIPKEIRKKMGL